MNSHELTAIAARNILWLINAMGIKQYQLAEMADLHVPDVSKLLRAARDDGAEINTSLATLSKIADALRVPVSVLMSDTLPTLLLGTIAAGANDTPITYDEPEVVTFGFPVPKDGFALRVSGHSCSRWGICHDDVIAIKLQTEPQEGAFCVLRSSGGNHTLKAYSRGKWWQFRPTDSEPVEYQLDAATNMFGIVIGGKYGERGFTVPIEPIKKPKKK